MKARTGFDTRNLAVAVAGFTAFINLYTPQAVLPDIAGSFAAGPAETGLAITASLLAVALIAPFVGGVSDALGRKRLIAGAGFVLTIPALLIAASPSLKVLIALRFAQGLLLPFIFTVTVAYIGEECPGEAGSRAARAYAAGTILGGFLGRFVAGIAADLAGWRTGFAVIGAMTFAAAALLAWLLPRERNFRPIAAGWAVWRMHLADARLRATCVIGACMLFSMVAAFTYANFRLAAPPFGLTPGQLGGIFAVYLLGLVTTTLATRLAIRLGRRTTLLLSVALSVLGTALTLGTHLPSVILGLGLLSGGMFVVQTLSLGFIAEHVRQAKSSAVGLYVTTYYIGGAAGGVLPAALWRHYGWPGVALLLAAAAGLIAALGAMYWPRRAFTMR